PMITKDDCRVPGGRHLGSKVTVKVSSPPCVHWIAGVPLPVDVGAVIVSSGAGQTEPLGIFQHLSKHGGVAQQVLLTGTTSGPTKPYTRPARSIGPKCAQGAPIAMMAHRPGNPVPGAAPPGASKAFCGTQAIE